MLWCLIEVGSVFFWLITLGIGIVIFSVLDSENGLGKATGTMAAFVVGLLLFSTLPQLHPLDWFNAHWLELAIYSASYIVLGGLWSRYPKWGWFLRRTLNDYIEERTEWLKDQGIQDANRETPVPTKLAEEWRNYAYSAGVRSFADPTDNKARIVGWAIYWPISLLNTLLKDWITELYNWLFDIVKGWYEAPAKRNAAIQAADFGAPKH